MKKTLRLKTLYFVLLIITIMFMPGNVFSAAQKTASWLDEPVTIRFQNETLSSVLEKIAKQTGIAILYDQELANDKVTGNYKDVKASDAITRLFSSKNKSIQVSKDKKVIVVKTFGAKNFIWAGVVKVVQGRGQDGSSPMTSAELAKLHSQQYKEYKDRIANDSEILEDGITRGALRAMHEQQYKEYQARIADDNEVLEGGMTRGKIRGMQKKQNDEYQASLKDDTEVLEGGMTRAEVRAMQKKQYDEHQLILKDDTEVLEDNMTRAEVRDMQEQQYKEYKENLK